MLSSKFYENIDPSYCQLIKKLEQDLADINADDDTINGEDGMRKSDRILFNFASEYMLPLELWDRMHVYNGANYDNIFSIKHHHFNFSHKFLRTNNLRIKYIFTKDAFMDESCLTFPHWKLDYALTKCKNHAYSPLSQTLINKYKQMKVLYEKIISVMKDEDKWMETLKEHDDNEFTKINVEYRLGSDLTNKKLWKLYIEFLKEKDSERLLQVYSKYCRFWLDDTEKKEEYRKASESYSPVKVPWKNTFDFEIYNKNFVNDLFKELECEDPDLIRGVAKSSYLVSKFSSINAASQLFPFRPNLMRLIWDSANAGVQMKLFKTCKYFFIKYPTPICYSLSVQHSDHRNEEYFQEQSLKIMTTKQGTLDAYNLHISRSFSYSGDEFLGLSSLPIPKLYRCDASYISLSCQKFALNELKFLLNGGNVEELCFYKSAIVDVNGKGVPLETILRLTPKITCLNFFMSQVICTPHTSKLLLAIRFQNKFQVFHLTYIEGDLEPYDFREFLMKNCVFSCHVHLLFVDKEKGQPFLKTIEPALKTLKKEMYM